MKRREVLFAVIGGVVGAVLVMAAGAIAPEVKDAKFREVACRALKVVDAAGESVVSMSAAPLGGVVLVGDKNGNLMVSIGVSERGGLVAVSSKLGEQGFLRRQRVVMTTNEYGDGEVLTWNRNGDRAATLK